MNKQRAAPCAPYNFVLVGFTRIYSDLVWFFGLLRRLPQGKKDEDWRPIRRVGWYPYRKLP